MKGHVAFLAEYDLNAARRLVKEFDKAATSLELMPQRCTWLSGEYIPPKKYRVLLFEKRYLIVFQIIDKTVHVDYVVDCRQDYNWLIK